MRLTAIFGVMSVMLLALATASVRAHEVTYEGTVASVEPNRFASSPIVATVGVKSDRGRISRFEVTQKTRILRGNKEIGFSDARIQKDEPVVVVIIDEESFTAAVEVRLKAEPPPPAR